jgi:hypothetical protein
LGGNNTNAAFITEEPMPLIDRRSTLEKLKGPIKPTQPTPRMNEIQMNLGSS